MSFYLMMAGKYANIRTFAPEDGTGSGSAAEKEGGDGDEDGAGGDESGDEVDPAKAAPADAGEKKKAVQKAKEKPADVLTIEEIKAQLEATKAEKADLLRESMARKERLKQFEGVDPEKYRKLVEKEQAAELAAAEEKGEFERVKQMMADAHKTEKEALEATIAELRAKLGEKDKTVDELSIGNAFGNSSFIKESLMLTPAKTRALYGAHFETENGVIVAYDKPKGAAERTKLVDASGDPLPFDAALEKIVNADPEKNTVLRWKARNGAGSGTDGDGNSGKQGKEKQGDDLYGASRIAASLRNW